MSLFNDGRNASFPPPPWSIGEVIVTVSPQEAQDELKRFDSKPLIYVAHPVTVDVSDATSELGCSLLERKKGMACLCVRDKRGDGDERRHTRAGGQ